MNHQVAGAHETSVVDKALLGTTSQLLAQSIDWEIILGNYRNIYIYDMTKITPPKMLDIFWLIIRKLEGYHE